MDKDFGRYPENREKPKGKKSTSRRYIENIAGTAKDARKFFAKKKAVEKLRKGKMK